MSDTGKPCFKETTQERVGSEFAAAGSTSPDGILRLPVTTTLQYSPGQVIRKVEVPLDNQERHIREFFHSGHTATMKDKPVSVTMMNRAMPVIEDGTGNFGFVFSEELTVKRSCFEKNENFVEKHACGAGASGQVHAFLDTQCGQTFVRKRLKKGTSLRKEEVQALIQLDHPGVVKLFAFLCSHATVDLLMQNAGYPLRSCLREFCKKQISPGWYWRVVADLAKQGFKALNYIHRKRISHNDVKPENLLVHQTNQRSLRLVLTDFGSCVPMDSNMAFTLELTPEYWSPEMWWLVQKHLQHGASKGLQKVEAYQFKPQAGFDTYAMGLCVYYMATLKHLLKELEARQNTTDPLVPPHLLHGCQRRYPNTNAQFVFKFVLMTRYPCQLPDMATTGPWLFPSIPPALLQVIRHTLNRNPNHRWTDKHAAVCLSEGAENPETDQQRESHFKTPTPVMDTSSTHAVEAGQAGPYSSPVPETGPSVAAAAVDVSRHIAHTDQPQTVSSTGLQRFQQSIAPFMKCWDKVTGSELSPTAGPQGQAVATNIPHPTSGFQAAPDDIPIRPPSVFHPPAAPKPDKPFTAPTPDKPFTAASPECKQFTVPACDKPLSGSKPATPTPGRSSSDAQFVSLRAPESTLQEHHEPEGSAETGEEKSEVDMDMKTMETVHEKLADPQPQSGLQGFENGNKGQGGVKRKALKTGLEADEPMEVASKVRTFSREVGADLPIKQCPSPGKRATVCPGKSVSQARQPATGTPRFRQKSVSGMRRPATDIPFVVASSSRPNLSTRTMAGLALTFTDPRPEACSFGGCPVVPGGEGVVAVRDTLISHPQATFCAEQAGAVDSQSQGGCVPVTGLPPTPVSSVTLPPTPVCEFLPTPQSVAVSTVADPHLAAPGYCLTGAQPEAIEQVDLDELLQLLETNQVLEQPPPDFVDVGLQVLEQPLPLRNDVNVWLQEQSIPAVPGQPPPSAVVDRGVSDMMEDSPMETTGNIPDFVQLFD